MCIIHTHTNRNELRTYAILFYNNTHIVHIRIGIVIDKNKYEYARQKNHGEVELEWILHYIFNSDKGTKGLLATLWYNQNGPDLW